MFPWPDLEACRKRAPDVAIFLPAMENFTGRDELINLLS
jgi:hypothetical protein